MESLLAAAPFHVAAFSSVSSPSAHSPSVLRSIRGGGRAVRCASAKEAILYALEHDEMFNSEEVIQWESGKTINSIAAAQGIRIRRRCRPRYPSEGSGDDKAVPRNILEQIVWDKEVEVSQRKAKKPLKSIVESSEHAPPARDFIGALTAAHRRNGVPALIAEVKKASPSRGVLRENFNPVEIAQAYEKNGAACLSILTDEKHFQGSFENLETVRNSGVQCPLLCKEFVIDIWQIYYARSKGADAILLIAAVLPDLDMKYMLRICKNLGMTALIEVHDEKELDRVLRIDGVELIGINNRSLETFVVDTSNTRMLMEKRGDIIKEKGILVVGESGLFTPDDVAYVHSAGVSAVLVGESLIKEEDPGRAIAGLFGKELLS
ncbi:Indole-3-glycerol phosphate synthase, chloroplastic [Triticum urartu]|uniref:indole-3-glycerol-phosphate synthase n=1 Tax=Triticum urartu TaxID=4572 RepID=M8A1J3_TRIUA|nr:indole-3-glycerol phosphate synthase, chloroplastic-like [Triticum urartu]EMS66182.1 Indole-3-glycerol phosphate synthase, chloroplastic [Triticum urartu]